MIVKNVLSQGYPFVEAVASALPICDEFLISDGYSTDGTFEILQKMVGLNKKIQVFRQEWPTEKRVSVLAEVTNWLRGKCKYDYLFSIQANEVVHEENIDFMKALPEMCPMVETFGLPFLHVMGNFKFSEEYRLRLARNLPSIIAVGDAWSLGTSKEFVRSEALKGLRHPRTLFQYVGRGIQWTYANTCGNPISRGIYTPKPIFRYWSLFPQNFLEKCAKHKEMFGLNYTQTIIDLQKHVNDDPFVFWKLAIEPFRNGPLGFRYPEGLGEIQIDSHPKVMQNLILDKKSKQYSVRAEALDLIAKG